MFIIECLPFSKGLKKESLSYFSSLPIEKGSIVKISLRGKNIPALVIESKELEKVRSEIRSASFQLKKISSLTAKPFLDENFMDCIKKTAEYFAVTSGSLLKELIPSFIIKNPILITSIKDKKENDKNDSQNKSVIETLQCEEEERFDYYRSLIREEFAKKKSVFFCLPQNENIVVAEEKLSRGIETFVATFHKDLNKKERTDIWKKATETKHPILIIATARWLFIPRNDLGLIIIEKENENGWKNISRPFFDFRFFIENLAIKKRSNLILADNFLRIETLRRLEKKEIEENRRSKWQISSNVKTTLIDLKEETKKEKEFKTLSSVVLRKIQENQSKRKFTFIFALRKGLSSTVICQDCGQSVKCHNCLSPMVLHKSKDKGSGAILRCHQCDETRDAGELCHYCKSWKLTALGVGIEKISDEIRKKIDDIKIFEISAEATPTSVKALQTIKNFYDNPGSVILGTEMAFPYFHKKVDVSILASFDSLFSIPDFRIREKIFRIILQAKNISKNEIIIQSRNEDATLDLALKGNIALFYKQEAQDRKVLNYPPFGNFIKITARGNQNTVSKIENEIKNKFFDYNIVVFNSNYEKRGKPSAINGIIKLKEGIWPDNNLLAKLKSLPPHFEIKVDPDNLL